MEKSSNRTPAQRLPHRRRVQAQRMAALSAVLVMVSSLCCGAAGATSTRTRHAIDAMTVTAFRSIREVWDDNRVARHRDAAAACQGDRSTLAIMTCDEYRTENVDVEIDALRAGAFRLARTASARNAINRDDEAWLANRIPLCEAGYPAHGGGTIVEILEASCETAVSSSRLDAIRGRTVPTAELLATDNIDPEATQYATAATGTRIGALDTQGDDTGGVVIAWIVIGGYRGFVVDPASFAYVDGSFVDPGVVYGHPAGHRVAAGRKYVFSVDYSRLSDDPNERGRRGRFEYRLGADVVGAWR
ncbi:MAG: hypothetical protein ACRDL5_01110 [Solirubrobacteraceae bacterium]